MELSVLPVRIEELRYIRHNFYVTKNCDLLSFREAETKDKSWIISLCRQQLHHCARLLQLCPTLCNAMDCRPPGSSVCGVLQARTLGWVAIPFSRASSWPRYWIQVSHIAGRFFTIWATREVAHHYLIFNFKRLGKLLFSTYRKQISNVKKYRKPIFTSWEIIVSHSLRKHFHIHDELIPDYSFYSLKQLL